jgi:hypothetical protein
MKHKWHDEIVAWAGGAEIEWSGGLDDVWTVITRIDWNGFGKFRIKPQPKQPKYLYVYSAVAGKQDIHISEHQCKATNYIGRIEVVND